MLAQPYPPTANLYHQIVGYHIDSPCIHHKSPGHQDSCRQSSGFVERYDTALHQLQYQYETPLYNSQDLYK